eukprot:GHVP01030197.1.p2 GENE.GHVP01030197.1~~GHVP01030197.1.p2  ORF type:complete len:712 (-),score=124.77 GHVP01030197.1:2788-4923(-)
MIKRLFVCGSVICLSQGDLASLANAAVSLSNVFSTANRAFRSPQLGQGQQGSPVGSNFLDRGVAGIGNALSCEGQGLCCLFPNFCHPDATCYSSQIVPDNWLGAISAIPSCECQEGFRGQGRNVEGGCVNIDECAEGTDSCQQICVDLAPGYSCGCEPGFKLSSRYECEDVDECAEGTHSCSDTCINTSPGYLCACPTGFLLGPDMKTCYDMDECSSPDTNQCDFAESCQNLSGGFACDCPPGWSLGLDKKSCVDINECFEGYEVPTSPGSTRPACGNDPSQSCTNLQGSWSCTCAPGFRNKGVELPSLPSPPRPSSGTWTLEAYNSFIEEVITIQSAENCEDIDECLSDVCGEAKCTNLPGSYSCLCSQGFQFNETTKQCEDIDECESNICGGVGQTCTNLEGSYECGCLDGYEAVGESCEDIDECSLPESPCSHQCINTEGSYQCVCPDGYSPSVSGKCLDIDECAAGLCGSSCLNLQGSYLCTCPSGYKEIGAFESITTETYKSKTTLRFRSSVEEFLEGIRAIDPLSPEAAELRIQNELLRNYLGEDLGRSLDIECQDVDECSVSSAICPSELACVNTVGSFECMCQSGFTLKEEFLPTGKFPAMNIPGPLGSEFPNIKETLKISSAVGVDPWEVVQIQWSKYSGAERAILENEEICRDLDECVETQNPCSSDFPCCQNTDGSFNCLRKKGFGRGPFNYCPTGSILV